MTPCFKNEVSLEEQKAHMEDRLLRRRQIAYMICENFRVTGAHEVVLEYSVIHSVSFYMAPVFRTPRGIKSDYQQVRFPMTVFLKLMRV